ncbi:choice-of-anchor tandem repeat GloVer-containing protein, partial [Acinetobacter baumannii]
GYLYGTTEQRSIDSGGILYKLATDGSTYQILQGFGGSNGYGPAAPPLQALDGNLYGTTVMGGIGAGNVYSQTLAGSFANVYSFATGGNTT